MIPFELQLAVEQFDKRREDDVALQRRLAWEAEALSRDKHLPSWDHWRKKVAPTAQDAKDARRAVEDSKRLYEDHAQAGDEDALKAFVMNQGKSEGTD